MNKFAIVNMKWILEQIMNNEFNINELENIYCIDLYSGDVSSLVDLSVQEFLDAIHSKNSDEYFFVQRKKSEVF